MSFNVDKLFSFCVAEIEHFAEQHRAETFYAFAIDASLLCLNSEEAFAETVKHAQEDWDRKVRAIKSWDELTDVDVQDAKWLLDLHERFRGLDRSDTKACLALINEERSIRRNKGNPHRAAEDIKRLRENTGDWAYQGFAEMTPASGFDEAAYAAHYDMSDAEQKTSAYAVTMNELLVRLRDSGVFNRLKTSPGFYAIRVEHDY